MRKVTVSIVCYNTHIQILSRCIECVENQKTDWTGIFIDHSPNSLYKHFFINRDNWKYIERGRNNDGFGGGNNFGIGLAGESEYYLLVNPDLYLKEESINKLIFAAEMNPNVGLVTGKITYPDGTMQKLNKRDPSILALFGRRFPIITYLPIVQKAIDKYEMSEMNYDLTTEVEFISGCLMLIPTKVWKEVEGFDKRYFLYFEDADITRKIRNRGYRTIYSPNAEASHEYQRGSHRSFILFFIFIRSMLQYFKKWGWKWK